MNGRIISLPGMPVFLWVRCGKGMPVPLEGHMMACDPVRKQLLVFGGWGGAAGKLEANGKTWVRDGGEWAGY